ECLNKGLLIEIPDLDSLVACDADQACAILRESECRYCFGARGQLRENITESCIPNHDFTARRACRNFVAVSGDCYRLDLTARARQQTPGHTRASIPKLN